MTATTTPPQNVVTLWQRRDAVIDPVVAKVVRYWSELEANSDVPRRGEIDPKRLGSALPFAFILHRVRPGVIRFRVAGQHLRQLMGMDVRGMPLRSFFELHDRKRLMENVDSIFTKPASMDIEIVSDAQGRNKLEGQMVLMPLKGHGDEVDRALGVIVTDGIVGLPPRRFRIRKQVLHPLLTDFAKTEPDAMGETVTPPAPTRPVAPPKLQVIKGGLVDA